jgi:hypothetical protein
MNKNSLNETYLPKLHQYATDVCFIVLILILLLLLENIFDLI